MCDLNGLQLLSHTSRSDKGGSSKKLNYRKISQER